METLINQKIKAQPVLKNVLKKKFFFKKKEVPWNSAVITVY